MIRLLGSLAGLNNSDNVLFVPQDGETSVSCAKPRNTDGNGPSSLCGARRSGLCHG